jgi:hypothetical protein
LDWQSIQIAFQISQHRQETLASLPLNNTIKEIFANIKATSDTKLTPPRALVRIHICKH